MDINKSELEKVVASLSEQGFDVTGIEADVTKEADIQKMVDQTLAKYGRLDIILSHHKGTRVFPDFPLTNSHQAKNYEF